MMGQQQQAMLAAGSALRRTMLALITAALVVAMLAALAADPASAKNSRDRTNISSSGHILNSSHDNTSNDGGPTGGGPAEVEHEKYSTSGYDFVETEVSTPSGNNNFNRVGNCRVDSACL